MGQPAAAQARTVPARASGVGRAARTGSATSVICVRRGFEVRAEIERAHGGSTVRAVATARP